MKAYAEAQIPWYLLVEPDFIAYESVMLRLFRLDLGTYVEYTAAQRNETLVSDLPFPLDDQHDGPARPLTRSHRATSCHATTRHERNAT